MTDESTAERDAIDPDVLRGMAAAVGVRLTVERSATLVAQAVQHFAQLHYLDSIADPSTEPEAELRFDRGARPGSD